MHELSIIKALLQQVKPYQDQERKIVAITIEIGKMTCVDAQRLKFSFDMVKASSGLDEVELRVNDVAATARCNDCGQSFDLKQPGQACPCGSYDYTLLSGQELNLIEIEFN